MPGRLLRPRSEPCESEEELLARANNIHPERRLAEALRSNLAFQGRVAFS